MKDESHSETLRPPRHCPACSQDLSQYPYYQLIPSPFARKLLARFDHCVAYRSEVRTTLRFDKFA